APGAFPRLLLWRSHRHPLLLSLEFDQGVGERLQISGQDLVELVNREVDAVVGDAVIGKVVRAYPLAAIARSDERFALVGALAMLLLAFGLEQPRLENA